jgi:hypothetical protein
MAQVFILLSLTSQSADFAPLRKSNNLVFFKIFLKDATFSDFWRLI